MTTASREGGASSPTQEERCETCRFLVPGKGVYGRCHRYPPQRITLTVFYGVTVGSSTRMPRMKRSSWCGEWSTQHQGGSK